MTGQRAAGRTIGAICAAPAVVLLPLGLLNGYRATCFPSFLPLLREAEGVTAPRERVVVDPGSDYEEHAVEHRHQFTLHSLGTSPQHGGRRNYRPTHAGEITYRCQ